MCLSFSSCKWECGSSSLMGLCRVSDIGLSTGAVGGEGLSVWPPFPVTTHSHPSCCSAPLPSAGDSRAWPILQMGQQRPQGRKGRTQVMRWHSGAHPVWSQSCPGQAPLPNSGLQAHLPPRLCSSWRLPGPGPGLKDPAWDIP